MIDRKYIKLLKLFKHCNERQKDIIIQRLKNWDADRKEFKVNIDDKFYKK